MFCNDQEQTDLIPTTPQAKGVNEIQKQPWKPYTTAQDPGNMSDSYSVVETDKGL